MKKRENESLMNEMSYKAFENIEIQKEKGLQLAQLTPEQLRSQPGIDNSFFQEVSNHLLQFFKTIDNDPRISVTHISLFCVLFKLGLEQKVQPILIMAPELMKLAKISGLGTYHRCIRDLHNFGYIKYEPSFNHRKKSKIYLLNNTSF
jgi:hypothetical protein